MNIQTQHLGEVIADLLDDHVAVCNDDGFSMFCVDDEAVEGLSIAGTRALKGDYSTLLVELTNGQLFRIQILAR